MKIVQINSFSNGSTGKIMMSIHNELLNQGIESYVVWGRGRKSNNKNEIYMNDKIGVYFHALYSRITGKTGFASKRATRKLIERLDEIEPDIIHLHNIHGYYINIKLLFDYIKKNNIKLIWTLHDCWAFTGHCAYFDYCNCEKWEKKCNKCPQLNEYPKSFIDNSKYNFERKKSIFTGIKNITIITPSVWLLNLVKKSFLNNYEIKVINNGIDLDVFKPTKSNFRKKYNLENKSIILGVANVWDRRKGLEDFIELSKVIKNDTKIIIIGLSNKQIKKLPSNIIGIHRTENQRELIEIYSSANIFFNPTREDNYPTVNLEAIACGTPVVTYNTGGAPETVRDNGLIVTKEDFLSKYSEYIKKINNNFNNSIKEYSVYNMTKEYLKIYQKIQ